MAYPRFFSLVLLCVCVFPVGGCGKSSDDLTAADLAAALDAHWWNLEIPEDVSPDAVVSIAFHNEDGVFWRGGGTSGWEPNSRVKFFLMGLNEEKLRYAFVGSGHRSSGSPRNLIFDLGGESPITGFVDNGETVSPGQILVRRGERLSGDENSLGLGAIGIAVIAEPLD